MRSSIFISENWMSLGSERRDIILNVSPSALLMDSVLSSEPSASKFSALHAPQLIRLLCLPSTGTRLKQHIFLYVRYHIPKPNALNTSYYDHQFSGMHDANNCFHLIQFNI